MTNLKRRIIVISDMWGIESGWVNFYLSELENHFDITVFNSRILANIQKNDFRESELHQQFTSGGIELAAKNLLLKEQETASILAFSIGGTIAWKSMLAGLKAENLFAVSSTRLRYEMQKPKSKITLFYGDQDPYLPDRKWFDNIKIKPIIYKNENHEIYQKKEIASLICDKIIRQLSTYSNLTST